MRVIYHFLSELGPLVVNAPCGTLAKMYLMMMLYCAIHEAGHALMAVVVGEKITGFRLGRPALIRFRVCHIEYLFGPVPSGLVTYAYDDDTPRWKVALIAFAGVLMVALVCAVLFLTAWRDWVTQLYVMVAAIGIIGDILPWSAKTDGRHVLMQLNAIRQGRYTLDS